MVAAPCARLRSVRGPVRRNGRGRPFNTIVRQHLNDMAPIEVVFTLIAVATIGLAVVASSRVLREREGFVRSAAQLMFVWLVPLIGPLITIHLLRRDAPRGSGTYSNALAGQEDGDCLRQRDATFESHAETGHGAGEGGTE